MIRNIGLILSGDLKRPILDGDSIVAINGKIFGIGFEKDLDTEGVAWSRGFQTLAKVHLITDANKSRFVRLTFCDQLRNEIH